MMMQLGENEVDGNDSNAAGAEVTTATPRLRASMAASPSPLVPSHLGGESETKLLSEADRRWTGTTGTGPSGRSPVRSNSPGSTHVARLLSTPRTTNSSSWSCTSIATPETARRTSRTSFSPSPEAFADSELELSLELVNHVPPHIAERLMDRLRAAEAARQHVENQCVEAEGHGKESSGHSGNFLSWPRLGWLLLSFIFLGLQAELFGAPIWSKDIEMLEVQGSDRNLTRPRQRHPATGEETLDVAPMEVETLNFTCEAFLWEAETEARELQRRHEQLREAFSSVLEAASTWVGYLQRASRRLTNESGQDHRSCVEASKPGQAALQALLQKGSQ